MAREMGQLNYYKPANAPTPAGWYQWFYKHAIHLDGSNWMLWYDSIPYRMLNELVRVGGQYWDVRYHPDDQAKMLAFGQQSIIKKIQDAIASCNASLDRLDLKDIEEPATDWRERQKRGKERDKAVKTLRELMDRLEHAGQLYKVDVQSSIATARKFAEAVKDRSVDRAKLVSELVAAVAGTSIEAAAKADEVPVSILADYAEDHGVDTTAVRAAFSNEPSPVSPTAEVFPVEEEEPAELPTLSATYARLRNNEWGVRLRGAHSGQPGQLAVARRQNGTTQTVRLLTCDRRFRNANACVWSFELVEEQPAPKPEPAPAPVVEAPKPEKPQVTTKMLIRKSWSIKYDINCSKAVITRSFNGEEQEVNEMTREQARSHYAAMLAQGYTEF